MKKSCLFSEEEIKPGDIVRIRPDLEETGISDIGFLNQIVTSDMKEKAGELITVEEILEDRIFDSIQYKLEGSQYYWTCEMFDKVLIIENLFE